VNGLRLALFGTLALAAGSSSPAPIAAHWVGSYRLPAASSPVAIALDLHGRTATVALGPGHSFATDVAVARGVERARFQLPGSPADVVFDGTRQGREITGTVTQGALHGTFTLHPGRSPTLSALGLYRSSSGTAVAVVKAGVLPTWLVELPDGRTHGLNAALTTVGTRLGDTAGDGTLAVDRKGLTWTRDGTAMHYARVRLRQEEVRVGRLAGTLTLPDGHGSFAAAALVHGSAPAGREEFQVFSAYLESTGVAVLAADKRGVGESGGVFPGTLATPTAVNILAADAQVQVRFIAGLPHVDRKRVGLLGDSQAGWVIAAAAARERAVRWAVPLVGPTTTVGETDYFATLAGAEQNPPSASREQMLADVRKLGPSGFDPLPFLRRLTIPVFWVYGDDDRNVPTELCLERLQSIHTGHDFTWMVLHMTHALIDLPNGLYSSLSRSRGFDAQLLPAVGAWLRSRGVVR
jgi:pimeloyl-ACP methyl ester carboxylesterase